LLSGAILFMLRHRGDRLAMAADRRRTPTVEDYADGVLAGDRAMLGRAITLIESGKDKHAGPAQELLQRLLPHTG
jgi:LAO/AO transport system kinase